jgi:hypothetical protein
MLLHLLLVAFTCTPSLAQLPWPHVYRDTRGLLPGAHLLLSVTSNVSASFAAVESAHAHIMQPLLQQLTGESVVWDIGAGIGAMSLHAAHRGARVYAFEWDPVLLRDLEASVRANNMQDRVTVVAAFPCARSGRAVMFRRLSRANTYAGSADAVSVPPCPHPSLYPSPPFLIRHLSRAQQHLHTSSRCTAAAPPARSCRPPPRRPHSHTRGC